MNESQPLVDVKNNDSIIDPNGSDYVSINTESKDKENTNIVDSEKNYDERSFLKKISDYILNIPQEAEQKPHWYTPISRLFKKRKRRYYPRTVFLSGQVEPQKRYSRNALNSRKYHWLFFAFQFLWEQFGSFSNLYFLCTALSQFIPIFQVGYLFTYVAPLVFVLSITFVKEAWDEIWRMIRDREINYEKYEKLCPKTKGWIKISAKNIKIGDIIRINLDQRVPADCVLLRTTEKSGSVFIRTSSLDGETDWKLRHTIPYFQKLENEKELMTQTASFYVDKPKKDIYQFFGRCEYQRTNQVNGESDIEALGLENTLWANTHIANGKYAIGLVVYTGNETRNIMNKNDPITKKGKLDRELNYETMGLFAVMFCLALACVILKGKFEGVLLAICSFIRFLILYSSIIPISLKVNMDVSKAVYSFQINRDKKIKGTIVRNSGIPEELGRISHLFCDKTGTLTRNEMIFKKLVMGNLTLSSEDLEEIKSTLKSAFEKKENQGEEIKLELTREEKKVYNLMLGIVTCHNVTPVYPEQDENDEIIENEENNQTFDTEGIDSSKKVRYEASSPDEVALTTFSDTVDLSLIQRDQKSMKIRTPTGNEIEFDILLIFPFTSASKRMGIFIQEKISKKIIFFMKGADVVMSKCIVQSDWLMDEVDELARNGLRTLVFAKKEISETEFTTFLKSYKKAKSEIFNRDEKIKAVRQAFEKEMDLIGVSGVQDLLQENVQNCLYNIRGGGIKVWMLTGDKVETAICIARSTRLIDKHQEITLFLGKTKEEMAKLFEENLQDDKSDLAVVFDGKSLQLALDYFPKEFSTLTNEKCVGVVCARCAPTQKALVVELVKKKTKKVCMAVGDGGNDVSMLLAANVGVGIEGKEGKQASLAADFSVLQFSFIERLIFWHGSNSYRRGARMSQFIIHRGTIISIIQAVFSALYYFATVPIFSGMLMVGYSTVYTMLPVFAIAVHVEISEKVIAQFPQVYKELQRHQLLSFKTFLIWITLAVYQGGLIMLIQLYTSYLLPASSSLLRCQTITYTALIFTEFIIIGFTSERLNWVMLLAEAISVLLYVASIFLLPSYFDTSYIFGSMDFWWKSALIIVFATLPIYLIWFIYRKIKPSKHSKLLKKKGLIAIDNNIGEVLGVLNINTQKKKKINIF